MKKAKCQLEFEFSDGTKKKFNNGKPFYLPTWTMEKQEEFLQTMTELEEPYKDLPEEEKTKEINKLETTFKYYVILISLKEIDDSITIEDLQKGLHAEDCITLYNACYLSGKRGIVFKEDFHKAPLKKK